VRLSATRERDAVVIAVSDNSSAAEHLPVLFDRLYHADAARSLSDSTGLGLAVVRSIVELHDGSVEVVSTVGQAAPLSCTFQQSPCQNRCSDNQRASREPEHFRCTTL
jgi:two-component system heavy metal sensor histidine kinase CusS